MSKRRVRVSGIEKKGEPTSLPVRATAQERRQGPTPAHTPQGAIRLAQIRRDALPADILMLQRTMGNRLTQGLVMLRNQDTNGLREGKNQAVERKPAPQLARDAPTSIQRKKGNEQALRDIQGHAMYELLSELQALAPDVRTDEEAGRFVGGPRLVIAMHAVRYKDEGKTWSKFVDDDRNELVSLKYEDQIGDVLRFLGAKDRDVDGFIRQYIRAIAVGWQGVRTGPNAQEVRIGDKGQQVSDKDDGIRRIPLRIGGGKQAIVLIPAKLNPGAEIQVLLHLHGHNVGYRGESLDTVRDIQKDQIEQQLLASGNSQMIGVLPQGSTSSDFPGVDTTTYLANVFTALNFLGVWGQDKDGNPIQVKTAGHKVTLSAHSGGGAHLTSLLEQGGKPVRPGGLGSIFLFDAINARSLPKKNPDGSIATKDGKPIPSDIPDVNNSTELKRIRAFVAYELSVELQQLSDLTKLANGTPDADQDQVRQRQIQFLQTSGFRLRGYYTPGWYAQIYAPLVKDISDWFNQTAVQRLPGLDSKVIDIWSKNYVIQPINAISKVGPVGKGHQGHDYILGQGVQAGKGGKDYDPAKGGALLDALTSTRSTGAPATIQRKKENEQPLSDIQGHAMSTLLTELQALPKEVRTDEDAGRSVGGPRLVLAMHAARYKDEGKTWSNLVNDYRSELVSLKYEDQIGDVLGFLGAKKKDIAAFLQDLQPPSGGTVAEGGPLNDATITAVKAALKGASPKRYIIYRDIVKVAGTLAWRANNPGNLRDAPTKIALTPGAQGTFAVFASMDDGRAAQRALYLKSYGARTVRAAVAKLTPPSENDTELYLKQLQAQGINIDGTVSSQIDAIMTAIQNNEGMVAGVEVARLPDPSAAAP